MILFISNNGKFCQNHLNVFCFLQDKSGDILYFCYRQQIPWKTKTNSTLCHIQTSLPSYLSEDSLQAKKKVGTALEKTNQMSRCDGERAVVVE